MKYGLLIALISAYYGSFCQVTTITGEISGSGGLSLDSLGNLYISDFGDFLSITDGHLNNVYKMTPDGNVTVYATGFGSASGSAFNSQGILYQADIANSEISKIENGVVTLFANTNLVGPVGIVFDDNDDLFACNCNGNTIAKITPGGTTSIFSSSNLLNCPNGITMDNSNNLYISNFSDGNVIKIDTLNNASIFATIPGNNNGHIRYCPVDSNFYVCSHGSSSIYKVDLNGNVELFAGIGIRGNDDGPIDVSTFSRPNAIAISVTGDTMYVNSSVPLVNTFGNPLNPSLIRRIVNSKTGVASLGQVNLNAEDIIVYPNPSSDGKIHVTGKGIEKIEVYQANGSLVEHYVIEKPVDSYDILLKSGSYFLKVFASKNTIVNKAVVVK